MSNPGDAVYKLGTIHLDSNQGCVVEVLHGVVPKTGEIKWSHENLVLPWDQVSLAASSFRASIGSILSKLDELKDVALYVPPPSAVEAPAAPEKPTVEMKTIKG
jgi:hypothetical protein